MARAGQVQAVDGGRGRATFYRPSPPLDQLIDNIWVADEYAAPTARERVLPDGTQVLIVHLAPTPLRMYPDERTNDAIDATGAVLCGARRSPITIGTSLGPTVGVHFKPGGARPFFGLAASDITERVVALETLWGRAARSLREQLATAPAHLDRARVVESILLARARDSFELSAALRLSLEAFEEPGLSSVAEVNRRTGFSAKRLSALFRSEVGLSPKAYWRVRRFRAVLRDLDRGRLRGAALASEHGYCDQPHFLREFRALAGSNPREYLAARIAGTDHVSVYG